VTTPAVVSRAVAAARRLGFPLTRAEAGPDRPSSCLPGTGRFLAMLAAGCHGGTIAECGTGAGIGAAWISSAMPADCRLVTAELDASLAAAAADLLAPDPRICVLAGNAADLLPQRAPFDVLFADCGIRDVATFGCLTALLKPGGRIVMDDLVPARAPGGGDSASSHIKRDLFARTEGLTWTEVVLPDLQSSLLVGTRASGPM